MITLRYSGKAHAKTGVRSKSATQIHTALHASCRRMRRYKTLWAR